MPLTNCNSSRLRNISYKVSGPVLSSQEANVLFGPFLKLVRITDSGSEYSRRVKRKAAIECRGRDETGWQGCPMLVNHSPLATGESRRKSKNRAIQPRTGVADARECPMKAVTEAVAQMVYHVRKAQALKRLTHPAAENLNFARFSNLDRLAIRPINSQCIEDS